MANVKHNAFVTRLWRANTDFSPITSKDAVLNYISKYASKGEIGSEAYSEVLKRMMQRNVEDSPAAVVVRQLLLSSVAERNYSAQKVIHLLMGWPLYHCSRPVVVISLRHDWHRFGSSNTKIVARYSSKDGLEDLSLFEFAKMYRFHGNQALLRHAAAIVRAIPHLKPSEDSSENEEYYKLQSKLHVPRRE